MENRPIRLFLVCILLGVYLLFYVNAPTDADGAAMLATAASFARFGRVDMNVSGSNEWLLLPFGRIGSFGVDNALYSKKGPTPSLFMLPLVVLADTLPWLPVRATVSLLNALITAATALFLFDLVRRLGFRDKTALAVSLIFGLCTLALVYIKTLFGEPLTGLLLVLGVLTAYHYRQDQDRKSLIFTGIALALIIGINTIYVLYVPLFGLYLFAEWPLADIARKLRDLVIFLAAPVFAVILLALYNWARFGSPLITGYNFAAGEGFNYPLLAGLYGLVLSPYRGIFFYSPVLLLAVPGSFLFRDKPRLLIFLLALIGFQTLAFASWWSWYGGVVWGPRFLLPAIPLACLLIAPLIERSWSRRVLFVGVGVVTVLSALVQVIGGLLPYLPYENYLSIHFHDRLLPASAISDPMFSPILGHLVLLLGGYPLNPAWQANSIDFVYLAAVVVLIATGFLIFRRKSNRRSPLIVAVVAIICLNIVAARQMNDPQIQKVQQINDALTPPGTVLAATTLFGDSLIDVKNGSQVITMNAPTLPTDDRAQLVWNYALHQNHLLWLVTWFPSASLDNWQEYQLWQTASFVRETFIAGHRAVLFNLTAPQPSQQGGWHFGSSISLAAYTIQPSAESVDVAFQWEAITNPDQNYKLFVHLVNADGQIFAQQDRQPVGGYMPTTTWQPGTPVIDRLSFIISAHTNLQNWHVRVGLVDPATSKPISVMGSDGQVLADPFLMLKVIQ